MGALKITLVVTGLFAAGLGGRPSGALRPAQEVVEVPAADARAQGPEHRPGPGPVEVDRFHPAHQPDESGARPPLPEPALGGSVSVHLLSRPRRLNTALTGSGFSRRILLELHEPLVRTDWETWEAQPNLARAWTVEDQLVLKADAPPDLLARARTLARRVPDAPEERDPAPILYGELEQGEEDWRVVPRSRGNPLREPLEVPAAHVREVVREAVVTFELRDDVRWHPSPGFEDHRLDARDVLFSWEIHDNPEVECGERRYQFLKVAEGELVDPLTARFFLSREDVWAVGDLAEMCLLPTHLYDLGDPDHAEHDPDASPTARARHINDNPHNRDWIGLGPYRLESFGEQVIEAVRFEEYFDPARAGYLDRIRWRYIPGGAAALQALLEGELDYFDRLKAEDYFGEATASEAFRGRLYRGWSMSGSYAYLCWNLLSPGLSDVRVRRALGLCIDVEKDVLGAWYRGLGNRVTGPFPYHSPGYNHDVPATPNDPAEAQRLLAEAGWYDRDGDGWVDKDGEPLRIEYAAISESEFSRYFGLLLQEELKRVGVEVEVRDYEFATFRQGIQDRAYDAFTQAWLPPLEPDPEQLWHSRWGRPGLRSANYAALRDPVVDALIERGQQELDDEKRWAIWRDLSARLAEQAPYLWLVNPATKFALDARLRGFQGFHLDPGYSIRRWYLPAGTPGTRSAEGVGHWSQEGR